MNAGANDPYPDAAVFFWRSGEKESSKELLYVGALIALNWIVLPRDFYSNRTEFKSIVLCIGSKYETETHRTIESTIVGEKEIPETNRFIILVVSASA